MTELTTDYEEGIAVGGGGRQTRLAVVEDDKLCELYYERPGSEYLSGNLYLGRVQNVLPGMNAAFVDIGLDKNAFLYAGDIPVDTREAGDLADRMRGARIEKMLHPGQELLVQVVKEPGGTKGCRVSSHITVPGRMTVLLPTVSYVGISRKIVDPHRARPAARDRRGADRGQRHGRDRPHGGDGRGCRRASVGLRLGVRAVARNRGAGKGRPRAEAHPFRRQPCAARRARHARRFGRGHPRGRRGAVPADGGLCPPAGAPAGRPAWWNTPERRRCSTCTASTCRPTGGWGGTSGSSPAARW